MRVPSGIGSRLRLMVAIPLICSHRLPSGGGVARETSTVWRQVATGDGGYGLNRSHPLPSGGRRGEGGFHRLATGGYGRQLNGSHRLPHVAIRCQAVDSAI
jgi:hypothetical protein